ncbi:hypothetical protein [Winogradskya consettensis]|nr:hypothetical protein [Actinoplanes consettensis]
MFDGEISLKTTRACAAVAALAATAALAACNPGTDTPAVSSPPVSSPSASVAAPSYFGSDGYGKLTIGMSEKDALATGDLRTDPVSTVLDKNVYSFADGPEPDAKQMAFDEKIEKAVEAADKSTDTSAAGSAKAAKAYADSTQRLYDRLIAYLTDGGASFTKGKLVSIAADKDAETEAGIKRGSKVAELKTAYDGKGLTGNDKDGYELPITGHNGWRIRFEADKGTIKYMSLGK